MPKYRLVEREGVDTLHRDPATENCNLDDTTRDSPIVIADDEAWSLVTGGSVHACQYCFPLPSEVVDAG